MVSPAAPNQSTTTPARCAAAGRPERVQNEFNGVQEYSYTRWAYPSSGNKVNQYATNTDGTQTEAQYGGCGCAGGETVTLLGENLAGQNEAVKRRKQMIYSDFLGRTVKAETYNWPAPYDNGAVYASVVTEYNARDQVRFVKQYAGAASGAPGL
jgi:hypothetical protein